MAPAPMNVSAYVPAFRDQLADLRILVVGDLMLDRYLWGRVTRISPEAPVPIVDVEARDNRPGGAANVALNIAGLGAQVSLAGTVGQDDEGEILLRLLEDAGFATELILRTHPRPTTTKTRVIGNNQQILRVDREVRDPLPDADRAQLYAQITAQIGDCDAIIFEDYDKGVLTPELIGQLTERARAQAIPTVVDPKYRNFLAYRGVTVFKPNLKELNEALSLRLDKADLEGIRRAIGELRDKMPHHGTLITLSENGVLAVDEHLRAHHVPAHYRKIADVSGAGDTVVALMGIAMARKIPLAEAAAIANLAGGLVCEEVGVVPINKARLLEEMQDL
ncbi:MAG: bifunctional ADP-heptose synthase [Bacteroidota bacterium]